MAKGDVDELQKDYDRLSALLATLTQSMADIGAQAKRLGVDPKIFKDLQKAIEDTDAAQKRARKALLEEMKRHPGGNTRSPPSRG